MVGHVCLPINMSRLRTILVIGVRPRKPYKISSSEMGLSVIMHILLPDQIASHQFAIASSLNQVQTLPAINTTCQEMINVGIHYNTRAKT